MPAVGIYLDVHGAVGAIPYDIPGWVVFSNFSVAMTLNTSIENGHLHAAIRQGSASAAVGGVSTAFPGLEGWILNNVVVPLAQGPIRNAVAGMLSGYIASNVGAAFDGMLSGLDLTTLGSTSFGVPTLFSSGNPIPLTLGLGISKLVSAPSGMAIGVSTQLSAPPVHTLPSLGIAIPSGPVLDSGILGAPSTMGVAAHVGILNQALHALWRGGLFHTTLAAKDIGSGLPDGTLVKLAAKLPPVVGSKGDAVELALGSMDVELTYPGLFGGTDAPSKPVPVQLGARVTVTPTLKDGALRFENVDVTELHFSTGGVALPPTSNQMLTFLLRAVRKEALRLLHGRRRNVFDHGSPDRRRCDRRRLAGASAGPWPCHRAHPCGGRFGRREVRRRALELHRRYHRRPSDAQRERLVLPVDRRHRIRACALPRSAHAIRGAQRRDQRRPLGALRRSCGELRRLCVSAARRRVGQLADVPRCRHAHDGAREHTGHRRRLVGRDE